MTLVFTRGFSYLKKYSSKFKTLLSILGQSLSWSNLQDQIILWFSLRIWRRILWISGITKDVKLTLKKISTNFNSFREILSWFSLENSDLYIMSISLFNCFCIICEITILPLSIYASQCFQAICRLLPASDRCPFDYYLVYSVVDTIFTIVCLWYAPWRTPKL